MRKTSRFFYETSPLVLYRILIGSLELTFVCAVLCGLRKSLPHELQLTSVCALLVIMLSPATKNSIPKFPS